MKRPHSFLRKIYIEVACHVLIVRYVFTNPLMLDGQRHRSTLQHNRLRMLYQCNTLIAHHHRCQA